MRQTLSRGVFVAAAAATGILSLYGTPALADSYAVGGAEDSPGVLSGNSVQAPVHAPVNVCGNGVHVVGAFNETADNTCVNGSHTSDHGSHTSDHASHTSDHGSHDSGGAYAVGGAEDSPGVLSGNSVQVPVHAPVNVCGNGVHVVGAFNEAADNTCVNGSHTSGHGSYDSGGAYAVGGTEGSPGVVSGNNVQVPVHAPVNVCGNGVHVVGAFNEAVGNTCVNGSHTSGHGSHATDTTEGLPDVLSGNRVEVPVHLPVNVCGNDVDVIPLFDGACVNDGYGKEEEPEKETPPPPTKVETPPGHEVEKPPAEEEVPGSPPHLAETGSDGMFAASAAGAVLITGGAMLYRRSRLASRR